MDPRDMAVKKAELSVMVAEAQAKGDAYGEAGFQEIRERSARLKEMLKEQAERKEIAQIMGNHPAGDESGSEGLWSRKLSQVAEFKFARTELEALQKSMLAGASYRAKAVQAESTLGVPAGSVLDLGQIDPAVRETFRVADLIPARLFGSGGMEAGNDVTYYRPVDLANQAAAVAEAAALPQSSPTWEAVSEPIRKVAHYAHIPDEALQDWSEFQQVLGAEMLAGMIAIENSQLLVGSGVAPNLAGVFDDSRSVLTQSQGTDTVIDAVIKSLNKVRRTGFVEPDAIVLRSADWEPIGLAKNSGWRRTPTTTTTSVPLRWAGRSRSTVFRCPSVRL